MTSPTTALLVHGATLLTVDPDRPAPFVGWFAVGADGRLTAVEEGTPTAEQLAAADEVLDATGTLVGPGFVSAHSHLFTSGSRGLGMDETLYGWIEAMLRYVMPATPEDMYWSTRHGAQDFLRNGITTAYDFTDGGLQFDKTIASFGDRIPSLARQEAQLRAKLDAGLRSLHSVMLAQGDVPRADALAHVEDTVAAAADADPSLLLGVAVSGAVQWAPTPDTAALEVEVMRRYGLVNQAHFLETAEMLDLQRSKFAWYAEAGALTPQLVFGHFIQTTPEIIAAAAAGGCGMSWQPMSNGRLASGVASIPELRAAGMRVGMGLDDQSCTDVADPWNNMRTGIAMLRAQYKDPLAAPVADVLMMHTRGGAEALGVDGDVGSLRVGRFADFCVVDPRRPDTGPVWDAVGTYVLACSLRNLRSVWVGGRMVADGAELTDPQADEVVDQVHERMARLAAEVAAG
jgi:cytosine/adenosine deaminase-related metal-dependent hydrolase